MLGASGFAGGELLRLLSRHDGIELVAAAAGTRAGSPVAGLYPHLAGYRDLGFVSIEDAASMEADVAFCSLPHGESMAILPALPAAKIVDLGGDFRLREPSLYARWYGKEHPRPDELGRWVYGLTEWRREEIAGADRVANPGCYPAATILALAPLVAAGVVELEGIHVDAKSGVSGAGRAGGEGLDFASANENLRPYSVTGHKHIPEIEQELASAAGAPVTISFVPHLVPMTRGLLVTCRGRLATGAGTADVIDVLRQRYAGERFIRVLEEGELTETKRLTGTNGAEVTARVDERTGTVLAFAALDNLGKGAAGQALQNANLMLGLDEGTGLDQPGMMP